MENNTIFFDFDMGQKDYLEEIKKYSNVSHEASAIRHDKKKFSDYYDINLAPYLIGKGSGKFILPYEMSGLYCLMMSVMKSNPASNGRGNVTNCSLMDIIEHNKRVIESINNLPPYLVDYIKMSTEYSNALYLIKYVPVILERMSALLYIILDATKVPVMNTKILDYLIDGLDDVYEQCFWKKARNENTSEWLLKNEDYLKSVLAYQPVTSGLRAYHLLDNMLADFFRVLNRENWPEGAVLLAESFLKNMEEKYGKDKNKDAKIKNEFLFWLCNQEWHVLHKTATPMPFFLDNLINEKLEEYNDRYNIHCTIYTHSTDNNKEKPSIDQIQKYEKEISIIKQSLQNVVDICLIKFLSNYLNDLAAFKVVFQQPKIKLLSKQIFSFIETILNNGFDKNTIELLASYLNSTYEILENFEDKYKRYGLEEYVHTIIEGDKSMDECCREIYKDIFVKIQSEICEDFGKKAHLLLKDSLERITGKSLMEIITNEMS